ncbi:MAG TPA: carbamate kinase [Ktedonobacterales bacterium]|nr:carbamate kinase [Ktedonobacterales bacterium]
MTHLAVVAIGGNSLIKDSAHQSVPDQWNAVCETAIHIAAMVEQGWNVVVTHGNGPQVGFILLRSELSRSKLHPVPLDSCGADTQGAIGYMIQLALHNEFRRRGIHRQAVTLVTQVLVDANDPAIQRPSKPIGPFYTEEQAKELQAHDGWAMAEDAGRGWRRVVASPRPQQIIEQSAIQAMLDNHFILVAAGGGGIPVIRDEAGNLCGIEAVIDKDLASSLLASSINADLLLISTAVEKVALNYHKPDQRDLDRLSASEAKRYFEEGQFAKGSMGPKVQAALEYLERGGQAALITMPESIERALAGETGTWILPDGAGLPAYVKKAAHTKL